MADRSTFDRVLIDPAPADLEAALREALKDANDGNTSKSKHLKWPLANLAQFLQQLASTPEGLHGWHGGTKKTYYAAKSQITVAWWTNLLGEKHVRVLGGHGITTGARLRISETGQFRGGKPLSCAEILYPERTTRVARAGAVETVVGVCDCGAVGSFATLGWVGPSCGPCHDHRLEGNRPPAQPWRVGGPRYGPRGVRSVSSLAFDPAGTSLLFAYNGLERWGFTTDTAEAVPLPPGIGYCWQLNFRPNSNRAVLFGNRVGNDNERCVVEWEPGTATAVSEWHLPNDYRTALCLAPDGETVAVAHPGRANAKPKLSIRSVRDGGVLHELGTHTIGRMLFSPDGRMLLVTAIGDGPKLIDAQTGKKIHEFPLVRQEGHVFGPSGRDLYAISDTVAEGGVTYEANGVRLHVVKYPRTGAMNYMIDFLTVSPDGRRLVAGIFGALYFWELTDGNVGSWCEFHPTGESFERFAWSPDGRRLATSDRENTIRLWPWPAVYEAARAGAAGE